MTSIKIDNNCDIMFDELGNCEIVDDADDVAQAIRVELEQNKGQWVLNTKYGAPYLNQRNSGILQQKNNKDKIISEIRNVIKKYNNVDIISIDYIDNRIKAELKIFGEVIYL